MFGNQMGSTKGLAVYRLPGARVVGPGIEGGGTRSLEDPRYDGDTGLDNPQIESSGGA